MTGFLSRFRRKADGTSAVEFALIVPVLLLSLVGVIDLGNILYQRSDLESAVRSGTQYFMNGGTDLEVARQVVDSSWTARPEGAQVLTERYCMCGAATNTCSALCPDKTYPVSYNRIRVVVTFNGILANSTYNTEQTVRVR